MKESIKFTVIGTCSLAALWLGACQPAKEVESEINFAELDPDIIKKNLGAIRDALPVEDQLIYIRHGDRSFQVEGQTSLNAATDSDETFFKRKDRAVELAGNSDAKSAAGSTPLLKEKCFSTIKIDDRTYDPADSNYMVMGVDFAKDGTLVRSFLHPKPNRLEVGRLHNGVPFDLGDIQEYLADLAISKKNLFKVGGTWVSPGANPAQPIGRMASNGRSQDPRQAPNGKTPFYNEVELVKDGVKMKLYLMHFVMLNKNMRFTEQGSFIPLTGFAKTYYSPFFKYDTYRSSTTGDADDLKVVSAWFYRGGDINAEGREISEDEDCFYPYDFQLTSTFEDKKGQPDELYLVTPIIVDPGNGTKGPP